MTGYPSTGVPFEVFFSDGNGLGWVYPSITDQLDAFTTDGTRFVATIHYSFQVTWPDGSRSFVPATSSGGNIYVAPYGDVAYTYTPVPEPGTAVLLGLGLTALAVGRRRRSSASARSASGSARWRHLPRQGPRAPDAPGPRAASPAAARFPTPTGFHVARDGKAMG